VRTKRYFLKTILAICWLAFIHGCEGKRKSIDTSGNITPMTEKEITIYGSESCDHCIEFRNKMDSVSLKYTFKDADANEQYYQELLLKIENAQFKGYISYPVVEISEKIYVRPEFSEFLHMLSK
jgi:glutaredoxin